jgi:hypothetical protein
MEYELYHDESQEGGYWHGMLLVPAPTKVQLIAMLQLARTNTNYHQPLSLKKVYRKGRVYSCADAWIQIGVSALMSRSKGRLHQLSMGMRPKGRWEYSLFEGTIGAKFVVFRERDRHSTMAGHPDRASKIETTLRMGLKGGLHFFGSDCAPIRIAKMHFDGYEHYGRHLDRERIIERLTGLREYCSIDPRPDLIDDRTSDHTRKDSQEYDECQLLQLTDLLIGCFRTVLGPQTSEIHGELAYPVKELVKKYQEGPARMRNSRWCNSMCISQCYLENQVWKFETIEYVVNHPRQLGLPFQDG